MPPLFEGFLQKRGGSIRTWKRRYFLLSPEALTYSVNEFSPHAKRSIPASHIQVRAEPQEKGRGGTRRIAKRERECVCVKETRRKQRRDWPGGTRPFGMEEGRRGWRRRSWRNQAAGFSL